jgi:hypothetical protein
MLDQKEFSYYVDTSSLKTFLQSDFDKNSTKPGETTQEGGKVEEPSDDVILVEEKKKDDGGVVWVESGPTPPSSLSTPTPTDPSVLSNLLLLCEHGKLPVGKIGKSKRISREGRETLTRLGVRMEPELSTNDICFECFKNEVGGESDSF